MADQPFLASNSFDGDGTTVVWEFSFEGLSNDAPLTAKPYIDSADVKAELITGTGEDQVSTPVAFLFETANSIRIEPPVPVGTVLRIFRVTENRFPLVEYQGLQSVGASDLDLANRQALYIVQEARDAARGAGNISAEALAIAVGAAQSAEADAAASAASAAAAQLAAEVAGSADALGDALAGPDGAALVGFGAGTVADALSAALPAGSFASPEQFGAFSETTFIQALDTGKAVLIGASNTAVTLTTGANVDKLRAGYSRLVVVGDSLTITLPTGQHAMAGQWLAKSANNAKIKLVGAAPVETTISSILSVSGTPGNWTVVANVASGAGIAIGDTVCIKGVTPGVQAPGTYTGRPPIGAIQMQFFKNGSLSLAGQVGTVTEAVLPTYVSSGDYLIADGQVKRMLNITASGFTVDADKTPAINFSGKQYWYTMRPVAAGTVTVSGTTVTGSGTNTFTARVNPGDILAVHGAGMRQVVSVDSDNQLTINAGGMDVAVASTWGIIVSGELHEGAWRVTNVVGNQVTWINTLRTPYGPPVKQVSGGAVTALKTNLIFSGTSGFVVDGSALDLDQIGLRGSGGSVTVAVDLRGVGADRFGRARLGSKTGVTGFHYGSWLSSGAALQATSTSWGGQVTRGINVAGGEARLGGASITGAGGIGLLISEGGFARLSDARIQGNLLQGLRMEVGGSTWADFTSIGHNVQDNILVVGGVNVHFVGMRCLAGQAAGYGGQNGGYGRASGSLVLASGWRGINWNCGKMEANQSIVMGSADSGAVLGSQTEFNLQECAFGYNHLNGVFALTQAEVAATNGTQFVGNATGIQSSALSDVYAPGCGFKSNTADASAATGGRIFIKGHSGGTVFSPAINTPGADGSLVSDL